MAIFYVIAQKTIESTFEINADRNDKEALKALAVERLPKTPDWTDTEIRISVHEIMAEKEAVYFSWLVDLPETDE
jgi:hypothetical protein